VVLLERGPDLLTASHVLDRLKKFDIDQQTLDEWERALGLAIPMGPSGEKQYSPHHINLFKNVKKNMALGRTLAEIKPLITLPPEDNARPLPNPVNPVQAELPRTGYIASKPFNPMTNDIQVPPGGAVTNNGVDRFANVLDRVLAEKDALQKKVVETEKLNSHLYNANNMYHRKVKELNATILNLQTQLKEDQNFKLLDEKARLHGQLIQSEKMIQERNQEIEILQEALAKEKANREETELILSSKIRDLEVQFKGAIQQFDPKQFCGNWQEEARLITVVYDNFGINVEPNRRRVFQVSEPPAHTYGNNTVISTQYEYENNPMWKRFETLVLTCISPKALQGQLIVEYAIDGVPVCKAVYQVQCTQAVQ